MSKRAAHFTREKGDKKRNARPGNKNTAKGPRVGRREAPSTGGGTQRRASPASEASQDRRPRLRPRRQQP